MDEKEDVPLRGGRTGKLIILLKEFLSQPITDSANKDEVQVQRPTTTGVNDRRHVAGKESLGGLDLNSAAAPDLTPEGCWHTARRLWMQSRASAKPGVEQS